MSTPTAQQVADYTQERVEWLAGEVAYRGKVIAGLDAGALPRDVLDAAYEAHRAYSSRLAWMNAHRAASHGVREGYDAAGVVASLAQHLPARDDQWSGGANELRRIEVEAHADVLRHLAGYVRDLQF